MTKSINASHIAIMAMLFSVTACTATLPELTKPSKERRPVTTRPSVRVVKPVVRSTMPERSTRPVVKPVAAKPTVHKPIIIKPEVAETAANPYESVPKSQAPRSSTSSPAVKSLLRGAKVDIAVSNYNGGVNKLERAIRIEPRNAEVWYQLAVANYKQKKYASSVTMAQKSNRYTAENSEQEKQNWALIKKASKEAGDIKTLKKAIQYERTHL